MKYQTMKGHIRRLISGVVASKSARNNPPTTGNAEDEKGDLDKSSAINFEQKCKYTYLFRKTFIDSPPKYAVKVS